MIQQDKDKAKVRRLLIKMIRRSGMTPEISDSIRNKFLTGVFTIDEIEALVKEAAKPAPEEPSK